MPCVVLRLDSQLPRRSPLQGSVRFQGVCIVLQTNLLCAVAVFRQAVATATQLIIMNTPLNIITSYYMGVMLVETHIHKKDFQWYHFVAKPLLIKGTYQFAMLATLAFGLQSHDIFTIRIMVGLIAIAAGCIWLRRVGVDMSADFSKRFTIVSLIAKTDHLA